MLSVDGWVASWIIFYAWAMIGDNLDPRYENCKGIFFTNAWFSCIYFQYVRRLLRCNPIIHQLWMNKLWEFYLDDELSCNGICVSYLCGSYTLDFSKCLACLILNGLEFPNVLIFGIWKLCLVFLFYTHDNSLLIIFICLYIDFKFNNFIIFDCNKACTELTHNVIMQYDDILLQCLISIWSCDMVAMSSFWNFVVYWLS